jgi:hypothetical protein
MKKLVLFLIVIIPVLSMAQDENKFGIKFSGFVKSDIFYDSRQTWDAREGHFLLFPKNELPDINRNDINDVPKFNILSIQTRLKGVITGPDALGAKTSGLIEGAFFGNIGSDINGFRLRHAFVKLNWTNTELLVGQFWHPMFVTYCFPGTVSFNTGTPFEPFSRNPQIRLTQKIGSVNVIGSVMEQVDFKSKGPDGDSPTYLINSGIPEANLRLEYNSEKVLVGAGVNYKTLHPRLAIENKFVSTEKTFSTVKSTNEVSGLSYFGYFKLTTKPVTVKLYAVSGQLMYSMTMLGGYAENEIYKEAFKDTTHISNINYTPLNTSSFWLDIHSNGKKWQYGLFAGYSQNNGADDKIGGSYYSRGSDIEYVYRVAPRLIFNSGKFRIAPEIEYTVAAYAKTDENGKLFRDEKGKILDSKEIANFRFLVGVYYFF